MEKLEEPTMKHKFSDLEFINTAVQTFDIDPNLENKQQDVIGYVYSHVKPTPQENPRLVSLSEPALRLLDLNQKNVENDPKTPFYLSGNEILPDSIPIAHNYCGHQFGVFAGQLGDGRAITLGDIKNSKGELWELQLKGSGQTPYSRFADGKAVLRSSVREYLCSEALWALGIPTTRAASLVVTDSLAERDPLYTGKKIMEKCALVLRLAPSFWRFGSFEIFKPRDDYSGSKGPKYDNINYNDCSHGREKEMMPKMLDFIVGNYYPELQKNKSKDEAYLEMYYELVRRTTRMVALWQCYGFCHGVLNTDNMSILGLTIDFGPFGWMDYHDEDYICNHSDEAGRYSYKNQPEICKWNLKKLSEALAPMVDQKTTLSYLNENYDIFYKECYYTTLRKKLGLVASSSESDTVLIDNLFQVMHLNASDFTNTFRALSAVPIPLNLQQAKPNEDLLKRFAELSPSKEIYAARFKGHYSEDQLARIKMLAGTNPYVLLMMGVNPEVIESEEEKLKKYKEVVKQDENAMKKEISARWKEWLEKYMIRLFFETSSLKKDNASNLHKDYKILKTFDSLQEIENARNVTMNSSNPIYVLRNYMAEEAIRKAEKEDFSGVDNLLKIILNPFVVHEEINESEEYTQCPPSWASEICVSCSS